MSKMEPQLATIAAAVDEDLRAKQRRKKLFIVLGLVVAKVAIGYGFYAAHAARYVSTDNAYTAAETAQVTASIGGIVREVFAVDTQAVRAGEVLLVLDDTDAKLAVEQAEAELGRAVRRVRGYAANDDSLAAQITSRVSEQQRADAQVAAARADHERAQVDLQRREALAASGSVSGDELTRARNAFETTQASLASAVAAAEQARANHKAAIGAREANAVLIEGTTEHDNPEVAVARSRLDQARVNLERTVVRAPVAGVVARRAVQSGQQIAAGTPLLSVVPMAGVHVDANFKEGQLGKVRVGQPVALESDLYGGSVRYHGVVTGLAGGTGSTFATIPPQNATGNWIKVVQRVPVRIEIDPAELERRPLQIGLSMTATIDTHAPEPAGAGLRVPAEKSALATQLSRTALR